MANSFRNDTYRSAKTFSFINIGLFGFLAFCGALYFLVSIALIFDPESRVDLNDSGSLQLFFGMVGIISLLEIPMRILTIVMFLIWEYRSFNNLSALKARNLEYSPGWAVGWWFIPFANLVKPFQVMRELWNESDPDYDEEAGFLNVKAGAPELMIFWWAAFLLSGFIGRVADKMADSPNGQPSDFFPVALMIAALFQVCAAILALILVKKITERQEERERKINLSQEFTPPPPPVFDKEA